MDFGHIESQLEQIEQVSQTRLQEKESLEQRAARLQEGIHQLKEDIELLQSLNECKKKQEEEKIALEQKLDDCRCRVSQLESSLQELTDQTRESEEVLTALDQFGENVEEGMTVLKERKTLIEKCADRLHSLMERLGLTASGRASNDSREHGDEANSERERVTFCENVELVRDRVADGQYFSRGNHADSFLEYWENLDSFTFQAAAQPEVLYVKARDIEGVYLNDREVQNPEGFWTRNGLPGRSEESFRERASHVEAVKSRLDSGDSLEQLLEDPILGGAAGSYFDSPIRVTRCGDFYVFQGDGRHRTLAAQSVDGYLPVRVTGDYVKKG